VLRIVESWNGWLAAVWEGRGGMGKKRKEKQKKRVSADGWVYNGFFQWNNRWISSVGDSATSLYGYLSLNPSVIPSVKSSTSPRRCIFPDKLYTLSAKRLVYTKEIFPSIYTDRFTDWSRLSLYTDRFWDGIIFVGNYYWRKNSFCNSIGFLRFSSSLLSYFSQKKKEKKNLRYKYVPVSSRWELGQYQTWGSPITASRIKS
jgi:hypothetical protein